MQLQLQKAKQSEGLKKPKKPTLTQRLARQQKWHVEDKVAKKQ